MGTAISQCISQNVSEILLYARKKEICEDINKKHFNTKYYPNIQLNKKIIAVNDLNEMKKCRIIFLCIPSSEMRTIVTKLNKIVDNNCIFVSTAKGMEKKTNLRMSEIIEDITNRPAVALSGPNIASEMIVGFSTATTISSRNKEYINLVKNVLENKNFKVDTTLDIIGTEYCGIIKNILAISQGICEGLDMNYNSRFALFTKSYSEVKELIEKLGGDKKTVDQYCGFGDIITASLLPVSRNHTLGVLYGQGMIIDEKSTGVLFEGKNTTTILKELCDEIGYNSLTVNFVYNVIILNKNPKLAFNEFWDALE